MGRRHNNILETVGNTPVVRINKLAPAGINLFAKVESFNPMGSVKDRLALGVIEAAERSGELQPGQTIVEATSGKTGIGLAMVCAQKGYPLVITMAENFSVERRKMMRFLGARVVLTPAAEKGTGMVEKAKELAEKFGWWESRQFQNPANAEIHAQTTAVEILNDFDDITLDNLVTGSGTGGTLNGVSRVLREKSPTTKIIVCEPDNSQLLGSSITQARHRDGSHSASHPNFRPHLMQGWTPDFISELAEQAIEAANIDGYAPVNGNAALQCAKDLATREGLFVSISSGATLAGALRIAESATPGSNILCMLPDTGERYLTTPLFEEVCEEMSEEEIALSCATPRFRFDIATPTAPTTSTGAAPLDQAAIQAVEAALNDSGNPIVMFALEWCEFCWSVRKVLARYGIPYRAIDIDSVEYKASNLGGKMRAVLTSKTTWNTFPQIFINGEFYGGCTDLFDGCKDGTLGSRLKQHNIPYNDTVQLDPYSLLPNWLHPR